MIFVFDRWLTKIRETSLMLRMVDELMVDPCTKIADEFPTWLQEHVVEAKMNAPRSKTVMRANDLDEP
jgi:hypothetical protein